MPHLVIPSPTPNLKIKMVIRESFVCLVDIEGKLINGEADLEIFALLYLRE